MFRSQALLRPMENRTRDVHIRIYASARLRRHIWLLDAPGKYVTVSWCTLLCFRVAKRETNRRIDHCSPTPSSRNNCPDFNSFQTKTILLSFTGTVIHPWRTVLRRLRRFLRIYEVLYQEKKVFMAYLHIISLQTLKQIHVSINPTKRIESWYRAFHFFLWEKERNRHYI